ncbi:AraC family transcriptional regulator [Vibrio sp. 10N.286.49.C2]|uniref:helix-turn-helix domain-containing protein n=1 Tax=unclassified Vibrio TaxID=2614977 RepID=UPI000C828E0C|nr:MULTISPECIES: AraC family transcriptional regulator [unclassified Vibrio]PMH40058.1 AraC family transcriptional regulator [Vibrio sp. 10N.286.49.C2]PMH52167.1 AraC family transcriptional regulator [Vibrio sp. 10N.286.49.B1]PMH79001.1 AraC family transcriptional regulator [Vibrio sp. 10N.286.48.B7]
MNDSTDEQVPMIKSGYARIIIELLAEHDYDPHQLIKESGLPPDLHDLDNEFLPVEPLRRLLFLSANQLGTANFGELLRVAIRQKLIPKLLGAFKDFTTVNDALVSSEAIYQYDSIGTKTGIETAYGRTWYWRHKPFQDDDIYAWSEVFALMYGIEFVRALTKTDWTPSQVKLQSTNVDVFNATIGDSIQYFVGNDKMALLLEDEILAKPVIISSQDIKRQEPLITWHANFTDKVFTSLLPYVREHNLTLEQSAALLGMSPRTLQRRLNEERTSFRRIKDNLLFTVAVEMMGEELSLTHVSSQLGYSDISHFSRSFKRISGLTPKMYQKTILSLNKVNRTP